MGVNVAFPFTPPALHPRAFPIIQDRLNLTTATTTILAYEARLTVFNSPSPSIVVLPVLFP